MSFDFALEALSGPSHARMAKRSCTAQRAVFSVGRGGVGGLSILVARVLPSIFFCPPFLK
jgi:hypothetical protein